MPNQRTIHARAHAKINLALAVGPPEPPGSDHAGYHPVASWMHAVDLCDEITLAASDRFAADIAWSDGRPAGWAPQDDLCVRAVRAAESLAGRALPVSLRVRKSIPAGGGLGGGSADAGAVLLGLRDLFALDVPDERLAAAAHALGSDVPFFVDPAAWEAEQPARPALVTGFGERVERLARRGDAVTLVCPPFGCATGAVYKAFDANPEPACDAARVGAMARSGTLDPDELFNDLGAPAERVEPRLGGLRRALERELGGPVLVSGSGSTLFCFHDADTVRGHAPGCVVVGTRLV